MSHNYTPPPQLRLDFICNISIPNSPVSHTVSQTSYSQVASPSSRTSHQFGCYSQSEVYTQNGQANHDSYSRSCFCCGTVHYFYPDPACVPPSTPLSYCENSPNVVSQGNYSQAVSDQHPRENFFTLVKSDNPLSISSLTSQSELSQPKLRFSHDSSISQVEPKIKNASLQSSDTSERPLSQSLSDDHSDDTIDSEASVHGDKEDIFRCMWAACSAEFGNADDLIPHLSSLHLGGRERDSKCKWGYCNEYQPGTDELLKHLYGVHLGIEQVKLTCQWENCKTQYSSFDDLTSHLSEGHVGSGRSYYICGWSRCSRAGRPFNQRQKVMRHLQAHTGDKPYMCMVCEKRFAQSTVMSQHLRTHTGEKPFKCPFTDCGKGFSIAGSLTGHLRTHSGEKPFSCKFQGCSRQFSNSSNLTKHARTHTGERPFRCHNNPPCPKRFARPDQAARHMKVHLNSQAH